MANLVRETPVNSLTLDEAMEERAQLVKEMTDIAAALGDRNRQGPDGRRLSDIEYHDWRRRAVYAKAAREKRVQDLKERIRKLRQESTLTLSGQTDTSDYGLLKGAYELLRKLSREGVDFDPQEQALMDVFRERLQQGRAA